MIPDNPSPGSPPHALVLVNRKSRAGGTDISPALDYLRRQGLRLTEVVTDSPAEIAPLIRRHSKVVERVVIAGGDGTLNAAAGALCDSGLPFGILPIGTANDLARTLEIPPSIEEASRVIAHGRLRPIDLGLVNDVYFFNVASVGLSVDITERISNEQKRRWGIGAFVPNLVSALSARRSFRATVRCNGQRLRLRTIQISVGNGRHYGGGLTVGEDSAIDDGELFLYSLAPQSLWRLLTLAPVLKKGPPGSSPRVRTLRGSEIWLSTPKPMPIDTDGEIRTHTPAHFRVLPGAVRVFVPEKGHGTVGR